MSDTDVDEHARQLNDGLAQVQRQLRVAYSVVVVAAAALHHQNVDRDADVARVLLRCVGDRLSRQIACVDELGALERRRRVPSAGGG